MTTISRVAARARHRVLSLDDLRSLGYSRGQLRSMLRSGRLWRVYPGVFALEGALSAEGWAYAACLACRGYASRLTAAAVLGYRDHWPAPPSVTIVGRRGARGPAGIDVHHARTLDTIRSNGIPVTSPAQTIIDCARLLDAPQLKSLLRRAEFHGLDITSLDRPGLPAPLRAELDRYVLGSGLTINEIEARFFELAAAAGLPRPEVEARFPEKRRVDFVWHELSLIVETDGRRGHSGSIAFAEDRSRDRAHVLQGYLTLRYTWFEVAFEPSLVIAQLAAAAKLRRDGAPR
jgi:hypothetical protein